jgi:hypothetical protein
LELPRVQPLSSFSLFLLCLYIWMGRYFPKDQSQCSSLPLYLFTVE